MERFQNKRIWLGGGAFGAVLILAIAWFLLIGPEMTSTSDLKAQAASTREQNSALQSKVTQLKAKTASLAKYTASLKAALLALPVDSGLPAFTRQLSAQATANHVTLSSLTVGGVTAVSGATPATTSTSTDSAGTDTTTTTTPTTTATSAAGGLYSMQVTLKSSGTLSHQLAFLNAVRTIGPRRALIQSTQVSPEAATKTVPSLDADSTLTTQLTIYSAPQTPAQLVELNKLLRGKIGN